MHPFTPRPPGGPHGLVVNAIFWLLMGLAVWGLSACSEATGPQSAAQIRITDSFSCPETAVFMLDCARARSEWDPADLPPAEHWLVVVSVVQYPPNPVHMGYSVFSEGALDWYRQSTHIPQPSGGRIAVTDTVVFPPLARTRGALRAELSVLTGEDQRYVDLVLDTVFHWAATTNGEQNGG